MLGAAVWPVNNHPCIGPQQLGGERAQPSFGCGSGVLLACRYDALARCRQCRGLYRCGHFLWVAAQRFYGEGEFRVPEEVEGFAGFSGHFT